MGVELAVSAEEPPRLFDGKPEVLSYYLLLSPVIIVMRNRI